MRLSRLLIGLAVFALAGCVVVPERQHALVLEPDGTVAQRQMGCGDGADGITAAGALDPRAVRIASWNLHKQGDAGWEAELGRLIASSDVLLLQEAGVAKELRGTIERGGLSWVLASAFEYSGAEYGVLTATRVHPASVCTLRAYEPLLGIPKAALITQFRLEGRDTTLAVANLHSINFAPGTGEYRAQLDAIAADSVCTRATCSVGSLPPCGGGSGRGGGAGETRWRRHAKESHDPHP